MSVAANLLPPNTSGIETDTSGWTAGANTALSKSTRFYAGAASLGMTASAAGSVTATTSARVAVTTGREYMAYAYFANVAAAAGRTATVRVDWYAAVSGGTAVSSTTATAVTLPSTTGWMTPPPMLLSTAPAGAPFVSVTLTVTGLTLGATVVADLVSFGVPAIITGNLLPYAVQGCELDVSGWRTYGTALASSESTLAYEGWRSLKVTSSAVGSARVGIDVVQPVTPGVEYLAYAWVYAPEANASQATALRWYAADGTYTETAASWVLPAAQWTRCAVIGTAPAEAVNCRIMLDSTFTSTSQAWRYDQVALRVAPKAAGELLPYNVAGMEVDASGWTAVSGCTISRSTDYAYEGIASLKVTPTAGIAADATVELATKIPVTPRQAYQATPRVRLGPTTEQRYLTTRYTWCDAADTILQWADLQWSLSPTPTGGWYTLQTSTVAPTGAASLSVSFRILSPETAESIYIDDVSVVPGGMAVIADVVPERFGASLFVQGLTTGGYTYWGLWRMGEDGSMTAVRGPVGDLSQVPITGDTAVAEDYEAPLGTTVTYYLKVWTVATSYRSTGSPPIVIPEPPPTEIVLKDPGLPARQTTAVVAAGGQPQWMRRARQGVNEVRGRARPIIISDVRTSREGTMTLVTETAQELADMWWLLETGNTLLVQWPHLWGERDAYVQIGDVTEAPIVDYAEYSDRTWTIPLVEVDRPFGGSVGSAGRTWQTVNDNNADWMAVMSAATSWLDVYTGVNGG